MALIASNLGLWKFGISPMSPFILKKILYKHSKKNPH